MNWLLNRLKERSTWLAIFTLLGLVGIKLEPELRELIINAILAVAAIVAFVFRENIHQAFPRETPSFRAGRRSRTVYGFGSSHSFYSSTPAD